MATKILKIETSPNADKFIYGQTNQISIRWTGNKDEITQCIIYVKPSDVGQIENSWSARWKDSVKQDDGSWLTPPINATFKSTGRYEVEVSFNGPSSARQTYTRYVIKEPTFSPTISPSAGTLYPGDEVQLLVSVKNPPAGPITQKWFVDDVEVGSSSSLDFKFSTLGAHNVRCDVTINVDGFGPVTKSAKAIITCAKGTLDKVISISLSSSIPSLARGEIAPVILTSDHPADVKASYVWKVNDIATKVTTSRFDFKGINVGKNVIQAVVTFEGQNYEAKTVVAPPVVIDVTKITPYQEDIKLSKSNDAPESWGLDGKQTWTVEPFGTDPIDSSTHYLHIKQGTKAQFYIDDVLIEERSFDTQSDGPNIPSKAIVKFGYDHKLPDFMGPHKGKIQFTTEETDVFKESAVNYEFDFTIQKCSNWNERGPFIINGNVVTNNPLYTGAPGDKIELTVANAIDNSGSSEYKQALLNISKDGIYELINDKGVSVGTAVDGKLTFDLPDDIQTSVYKLRHTLDKTDIFDSVKVAELPIDVVTADSPIIPPLKLVVTQEDPDTIINEYTRFSYEILNLPEGAEYEISNLKWYVNGQQASEATTGNIISIKATPDKKIYAELHINVQGYNPVTLRSNEQKLEFVYRTWPKLNFVLTPSKTTIPWGDFIDVSCEITNKDQVIGKEGELHIFRPSWYLDEKEVQSLENGSLRLRATHPGAHSIKASIDVNHSEYEPATKTIQQSINITTEKRDMAVTLKLAPTNPTGTIGGSKRFTATIEGAPTDSSTSFTWTVDGVAQASKVNTLDYTPTKAGKLVVKVVSTTTAEGADDEVHEQSTDFTVNKKVMTITAKASTETETIKVGDEYSAVVDVQGLPSGAAKTVTWSDGTVGDKVNKTADTAGKISLKATVKATHQDYEDASAESNEVIITVEEKNPEVPEECPLIYVHPLPWRNSAYIWCGWWIMDAIESMTEQGKDWKTATKEDSKYYCHLNVLAKMLVDYPEVDVQESRNGYIVHRSALEAGIIY